MQNFCPKSAVKAQEILVAHSTDTDYDWLLTPASQSISSSKLSIEKKSGWDALSWRELDLALK